MKEMLEKIKNGEPIYIKPYQEPKVWGKEGIGEYWYGAEDGDKSSIAEIDDTEISMSFLLDSIPEEILGQKVVEKFGKFLPLIKLLTPKGRLSVQFHDAKNELWVITGIDKDIAGEDPSLIIGFNPAMIEKYKGDICVQYKQVLENYGKALNELIHELEDRGFKNDLEASKDVLEAGLINSKDDGKINDLTQSLKSAGEKLDAFYNHVNVSVGDVIPVPQGTLHALGAGIEVVEPQIPGPTQSMEDGATYPVRYYFPEFPFPGANRALDIDRIPEINAGIWRNQVPEILKKDDDYTVERLPGGFESKGMGVDRISIKQGKHVSYYNINSYFSIICVKGNANIIIGQSIYSVPRSRANGKMLLIPQCAANFIISAENDAQLIATYTPV